MPSAASGDHELGLSVVNAYWGMGFVGLGIS